jgi:hypothetical protein
MKRLLYTVLIMLITMPFAKGQSHNDTISIIQHGYYLYGKPLKPRLMLSLMKDCPDAYTRMKRARNNHRAANTLGITGGVLTGFTLVMLVTGGEPEMEILIAGAGCILMSIPFYTLYNHNAITAVRIYNSDLSQQGYNNIKLNLGLTKHGIGLTCRF